MKIDLPKVGFTSQAFFTDNFAYNQVWQQPTYRVHFRILTKPVEIPSGSKLLFSIDSSLSNKIFRQNTRQKNKLPLVYTKYFKLRQAYFKAQSNPPVDSWFSGSLDNINISWFESSYTLPVINNPVAWVGYFTPNTPDTVISLPNLLIAKKPLGLNFINYSSKEDSGSRLSVIVSVNTQTFSLETVLAYPMGPSFIRALEEFTKIASEYILNNHFLNIRLENTMVSLVYKYLGNFGVSYKGWGSFGFLVNPMYQNLQLMVYNVYFTTYYHIEDL